MQAAEISPTPLGLAIKHIVRTLSPLAGVDDNAWSGERANREIGQWLEMGYDLKLVRSLGIGPDGVHVLWVLCKRAEGTKGPSEVMHITRRMTGMGSPGTVTGFQADALLAGFVAEGWEVSFIETLGLDPTGGVAMFWLLTR